ncbi:hypothetical protein ACWCQZ_35475 [Streptomyces sp. NPDC002285]
MHGNAENDEGSVEEYDDEHGDDLDAADSDESADPEAYEEEDAADGDPDVFLDVPILKVDEIDLDVENLRAHVSLQAEVLDLLKLNVGADVTLGRVHLGISGVEAQAQLKVRLHNVAKIIDRVLTTLDRNPEILHELARGIGSAVQDVGGGAGQAVGEVGTGAGRAVQEVGQGAGTAVRDVGQGAGAAVQDVGQSAGAAVEGVGRGVGSVAQDVGEGAGRAVQDVGSGAGHAVEDVGDETSRAVGGAGEVVSGTAGSVVEQAAGATEAGGGRHAVADAAKTANDSAEVTEPKEQRAAREGEGDRASRSQSGTRKRRVRGEDGKLPPRSSRHRTARDPEKPP